MQESRIGLQCSTGYAYCLACVHQLGIVEKPSDTDIWSDNAAYTDDHCDGCKTPFLTAT